MTNRIDFNDFDKASLFSRSDLFDYYVENGYDLSLSSFNKEFESLINSNEITRLGRNMYTLKPGTRAYSYLYSNLSNKIAKIISDKYPLLVFSIFETVQLNEFVNHQIAHNTIMVYVENDGVEIVFEELKDEFFGKVLINPSIDIYHQYWCDDLIVVKKMVSEAPRGLNIPWNTRLEKLLVDIVSDKLLANIIPETEIQTIFDDSMDKYVIDSACLNRYARRRKATRKISIYFEYAKGDVTLS